MKGNEKRKSRSIRIEPGIEEILKAEYGSLQHWFDKKLEEHFRVFEATIIEKEEPKKISIDDF